MSRLSHGCNTDVCNAGRHVVTIDGIDYMRSQLEAGVAYLVLPNVLAEAVIGRVSEMERDNKMLRSEIDVMQRLRHAQLSSRDAL